MQRKDLKKFSNARIGLATSGGLLTTQDWLNFQKDYLSAKDALCSHFDATTINGFLQQHHYSSLQLTTRANDLKTFLLRPDLGRLLSKESEKKLKGIKEKQDLLIIISGGLSPIAINHHAIPFLKLFLVQNKLTLATIILFERSRVAIGDWVNYYIQAKNVMVLIGERPGLSSPDSMGIYFTPSAKPGMNDSQRVCLSNIHQHGMLYTEASKASLRILDTELPQISKTLNLP